MDFEDHGTGAIGGRIQSHPAMKTLSVSLQIKPKTTLGMGSHAMLENAISNFQGLFPNGTVFLGLAPALLHGSEVQFGQLNGFSAAKLEQQQK